MANIVFNAFLEKLNDGTYSWPTVNLYALLELQDANVYSTNENPDHSTVDQLISAGLTELPDGIGYSQVQVGGKQIYRNDATDKIEYRCNSLNFGTITTGYTIYAVLFYIRVGATYDPAVDIPALYFDTATGLPVNTNGSAIVLNVPVSGIMQEFKA